MTPEAQLMLVIFGVTMFIVVLYIKLNATMNETGADGRHKVIDEAGKGLTLAELDLPEELDSAIRRHCIDGQKIEAIKLLREVSGLNLKDAKDVIDRMDFAELLADKEASMEQIHQYVREGKRIEALKAYRAVSGAGLKEAKEEIDRLCREYGR